MPPSSPSRQPQVRRRERVLPRRTWQTGLLFGGVALAIGVAADHWHADVRRARAAEEVRLAMLPHADALQGSLDRQLGLLAGFRSFAESRPSRAALDEEFPMYATGTMAGNPGLQLMQFVQNDVVVAVWPLEGNEHRLNFNFGPVDAANRAAISTGRPLVTGPVELREGGTGILLRQQLMERPGFPDMATLVLGVDELVREAGLPAARAGMRYELRRGSGVWFGGDPVGSAVEPETLAVARGLVDWQLLAAPTDGWASLTRDRALEFRLSAGALVAMFILLGVVIGGREGRLMLRAEDSGTRLDLVLRAARVGVWEWDPHRNRVECTEAVPRILGFDPSRASAPDEAFFRAVHPDDRAELERILRATRSGERVGNVLECRVVLPNGEERWILSISEVERDEAGRPAKVFGVLSDVTDRRDLEARLRHAQRLEAVGQLAGGISHDFNNLLTAMIGFGELAHDEAKALGDSPRAVAIREDIGQVLSTANRAASLTGQLLAFSRRSITTPSEVRVNAVIRELEPMLGRLLVATVELRCDLGEGLPPVWVDSGQLTQVIVNLIVNARDAMPAGGTVRIRTSHLRAAGTRPAGAPPGDHVLIEVEDSGIGMSPKVQSRIFEPYFTTKETGRGTGLGLAVVYGAVEQAGGSVTVSSVEGEGSTFRVFLPPRPLSNLN